MCLAYLFIWRNRQIAAAFFSAISGRRRKAMKAFQMVLAVVLLVGVIGSVGAVGNFAAAEPGVKVMEWNFADGDAGGWKLGWNKTEDAVITDLDVVDGLGLRLKVDASRIESAHSGAGASRQTPGANAIGLCHELAVDRSQELDGLEIPGTGLG
jgi:hypothetical protein